MQGSSGARGKITKCLSFMLSKSQKEWRWSAVKVCVDIIGRKKDVSFAVDMIFYLENPKKCTKHLEKKAIISHREPELEVFMKQHFLGIEGWLRFHQIEVICWGEGKSERHSKKKHD